MSADCDDARMARFDMDGKNARGPKSDLLVASAVARSGSRRSAGG